MPDKRAPTGGPTASPKQGIDPTAYVVEIAPVAEADGGGWLARYPELPGCFGYGDTVFRALASGIRSVPVWAAERSKRGFPVPRPKQEGARSRSAKPQKAKVAEPVKLELVK